MNVNTIQPLSFTLAFSILLAGGYLAGVLFSRLKLPSILGMAAAGIGFSLFFKPYAPGVLWDLNPFFKSFALIVILLRAGLGISRQTLKKVGRTAFLMSWIPCISEGAVLTLMFHLVFGWSIPVSGLTAFMLAAVSPAVVVPSMLDLKANRRGEKNEVPTIVMAGASIDDVFAITLFSVFLGIARGSSDTSILQSAFSVPFSILLGIAAGCGAGFLLSFLFKRHYASIRATEKVLILIVCSSFLVEVGDAFHFASLLGIMTAGFIILEKHEKAAHEVSQKLSKIWIFAQIVLFVMIGFSLDIHAALEAGPKILLVISVGLIARSIGVFIATAFSPLSLKERLFCTIAYIPKATVQAALGSVPLAAGIAEGSIILAAAVTAILFTVPIGLIGIRAAGKYLLDDDSVKGSVKKNR